MSQDALAIDGLCVDVSYIVQGPLGNNVYVVSDGVGTFVVDPSEDAHSIVDALEGRTLDAIVLTHSHWDHTGAAALLRQITGAQVLCGAADADQVEQPRPDGTSRTSSPCPVDRRLTTGDVVRVGNMQWKVVETPGHSPGSICLFLVPPFGNHSDGLPVLISGDTLFAGSFGRTDFQGGSLKQMAKSMKKLAKLPDPVAVLPGHGGFTTIGNERGTFALFGDEPQG